MRLERKDYRSLLASALALHSLGRQIESTPSLVILKLFTGEELLWLGTTVGGFGLAWLTFWRPSSLMDAGTETHAP